MSGAASPEISEHHVSEQEVAQGIPPSTGLAAEGHGMTLLRRHWQLLALALGVVLLVGVVLSAGPARVLETLMDAALWLPVLMLADAGFFFCEAAAHRAVLGSRVSDIPALLFLRVSLVYYCVLSLAPLGHLGAEVARAAAFAPFVGAAEATAAAGSLQSGVLFANALVSIPSWIAVALAVGPTHPLAWLLALNGGGTALLSVATLVLVRSPRVSAFLGARVPRLRKFVAELDDAPRASRSELGRTVLWCSAARVVQVGQLAVLLAAVGAVVTVGSSLVVLGAHLVGAAFGDFVPSQMGVLEGVNSLFSGAMGLGADPARAVSMALLARIGQMAVASLFLGVLALTHRATRAESPS